MTAAGRWKTLWDDSWGRKLHHFSWWMEESKMMMGVQAGGWGTDSVSNCRECYLREGCIFKEGRKGHESLQQSGRKDGSVTVQRANVTSEVLRRGRWWRWPPAEKHQLLNLKLLLFHFIPISNKYIGTQLLCYFLFHFILEPITVLWAEH